MRPIPGTAPNALGMRLLGFVPAASIRFSFIARMRVALAFRRFAKVQAGPTKGRVCINWTLIA